MKILADIWLCVYGLAWWAVFWLPARKGLFSALAFIPAALCAFGIPMLIADTIRATPQRFLLFWSLTPFAVVALELMWRMKKS